MFTVDSTAVQCTVCNLDKTQPQCIFRYLNNDFKMALYVQLFGKQILNNEESKLAVDGITDMTVKQVKKKIEKEKRIPVEYQKLFFAGVELTNEKVLMLV